MKKFSCEKCLYSTESKFCFDTHKKSITHIKKENNEFEGKFNCKNCNKYYKSKSGYYTHWKRCQEEKNKKDEEEKERKKKEEDEIRKIVIDLYKQNSEIIKENAEMKNMLVELSKKENITNIDNSQNTNSHNKNIINIFLNDKCKNAINMSSLIESIVIGIKDIENIEKFGYVNAITNIITQKLSDYSIYERPLHYFVENKINEDEETPNESIHLKDNGIWNREDIYEHDLLLENMNTINSMLQEKTKENEPVNQEVKQGRRYDRIGKIITNILDKVQINEEQLC
jgi:predicted HTH domain antitoxin